MITHIFKIEDNLSHPLFFYITYFLINAISEFEKNTRIRYLGVDEKNVKITGFTTFDTLIRKDQELRDKNKDKNKILILAYLSTVLSIPACLASIKSLLYLPTPPIPRPPLYTSSPAT